MKVYLEPTRRDRGLNRVREALVKYAPPTVKIVDRPELADLEILHIIGRNDQLKKYIEKIKDSGRRYAMIQYVLRSTQKPNTKDWLEMWQNAQVVWSYYHLPSLMEEDELLPAYSESFNFYYSPLGVDSQIFTERPQKRQFAILANSHSYLTESVRECVLAAQEVKQKAIFLGGKESSIEPYLGIRNISDDELADYYSQCRFVSGLRRLEGFEFPVLEGALCGARPIVFDKPHYRKWFSKFAILIPEKPREGVIRELVGVFRDEYYPVTKEEKRYIKENFDWEEIIRDFWGKILE